MPRNVVSRLRRLASTRHVAMLLAGLLGGASVEWVTSDTVALPLVGSAPGVAVGGAGLAVAAVSYYQFSCMGSGDCGCAGDCNGSCDVDA